jgi:enoyl-CoA hydratase/carnithine racemase
MPDTPPLSPLAADLADGILTLTLNRPDKLNAYTGEMGLQLAAALKRADADDAVRVVIVTGAGRGFCAGADISAGSVGAQSGLDRGGLEGGIGMAIHRSLKPMIAAVNGPAIGVGVTMTLPMDIRLASENARFGFVFTRRGLVPEAGSAWFLPRIVGLPRALEWVYAGRTLNAAEALAGGLVSEVLPPDELLPRARAIAREIADNTSPVATVIARQMMWRVSAAPDPVAAFEIDAVLNRALAQSAVVREGFAALREKRPPQFPGKVSTDLPDAYPW